ncbi:MAG: hypothetical protein Q4C73_02970 [Eubacteriales bacterium]|nr:hypothetical protein [Eubacteriales bacterium]
MVILKYVKRHLYSFLRQDRGILFLAGIVACFSTITLLLAFGLYRNYENEKLSKVSELTEIKVTFHTWDEPEEQVTKTELDRCFARFSDELSDGLYMVFLSLKIDDIPVECWFVLREGRYAVCEAFRDNLEKYWLADTYFTEAQEAEGERTALVSGAYSGKPLILQGNEFQIIGEQHLSGGVFVPWQALEPETPVNRKQGLQLYFSRAITSAQYEELSGILRAELGDRAELPRLQPPDPDELSVIHIFMLVSALIGGISSVNFCILYRYIFMKRAYSLAVFCMCGMGRKRAAAVYILECMTIMIPASFAGDTVFYFAVLPWLEGTFPYMNGVFSIGSCSMLYGGYILASLVVTAVMTGVWMGRFSVKEGLRRRVL